MLKCRRRLCSSAAICERCYISEDGLQMQRTVQRSVSKRQQQFKVAGISEESNWFSASGGFSVISAGETNPVLSRH